MLSIESYFRVEGTFVDVGQYEGAVRDVDYIEGSISVRANNRQLLETQWWDYVDQLWAYLVDGLCCVASGEPFSCYFPDQPIKITLGSEDKRTVRMTVKKSGDERSAVIDRKEFLSSFAAAGRKFFSVMKTKVPEQSDIWDDCLEKLASIS